MKKEDYKNISVSMKDIEDALSKAFKLDECLPRHKRSDYYTPKEISPGLWQIGPIWTGDGGKKIFDEAVQKEFTNTPL